MPVASQTNSLTGPWVTSLQRSPGKEQTLPVRFRHASVFYTASQWITSRLLFLLNYKLDLLDKLGNTAYTERTSILS